MGKYKEAASRQISSSPAAIDSKAPKEVETDDSSYPSLVDYPPQEGTLGPDPKKRRKNRPSGADLHSGLYRQSNPARIPVGVEGDLEWTYPFSDGDEVLKTDLTPEAMRTFPTTLFPKAAFDARRGPAAMQLLVDVFRQLWSALVNRRTPFQNAVPPPVREKYGSWRGVQDRHDAEFAVELLDQIEAHATKPEPTHADVAYVASAFFYLGRLAERHEVRQFEELVKVGRHALMDKRSGAAAANDDFQELRAQYPAKVEQHMTAGSSYSAAIEAVARELGVCGRTVRNYTKNLSPSHQKNKLADRKNGFDAVGASAD